MCSILSHLILFGLMVRVDIAFHDEDVQVTRLNVPVCGVKEGGPREMIWYVISVILQDQLEKPVTTALQACTMLQLPPSSLALLRTHVTLILSTTWILALQAFLSEKKRDAIQPPRL